ncbi:MAG: DMT family transporter [Bacteroidales bacterium]|nr:DMT family transporter [Bacteroidales bacterium]MCF8388669.1 DMT family transporter [Bacteroidales bacterium]MCF8399465.1 DMT family transporter [Bacteroidales bacterium]
MDNRSKSAVVMGGIAVSFSAVLWGFDGVVLTPRLYNLNIGFVVFMLHALPFLLMNLVLFGQYKYLNRFSGNDYLVFTLIALFGGAIGTMAIVKALFLVNFQKLTIVVLLQKMQPIFAIALAAIFLKEKLGKNYILWAGLAIIAGYFLTFGTKLPNLDSGSETVYASLFALLAAFSFGSSTVLSKKILNRYSFYTATFYRYGFTGLIMTFFILITGKINEFENVTTDNWIIFLIIAVTTGSGAIFLYYYGLKKVRAIIATICELFFPLSAIIFDYIFNDQHLSFVQWISAALMIFAIVNLNISNRKRKLKNRHA